MMRHMLLSCEVLCEYDDELFVWFLFSGAGPSAQLLHHPLTDNKIQLNAAATAAVNYSSSQQSHI